MTLRDAVEMLEGQYIKVGISSGFIYIHKVDESTLVDLSTINDVYKANADRLIQKHTRAIEEAESRLEARIRTAKYAKANGYSYMLGGSKVYMDYEKRKRADDLINMTEAEKKAEIKKAKETAQKRIDRLMAHKASTHLLDRKVLEIYQSDPFCGGEYIVLLEGAEDGVYWTREEYEKYGKFRVNLKLFEEDMEGKG